LTAVTTEVKLKGVPEKPTTVEEYLETLNADVRPVVEKIRSVVHASVDGLEDCISYAIPAMKLNGKIVLYYSGWTSHVSVYPIPPGSSSFERSIAPYVAGKGTLKFPVGGGHEVPYNLIANIALAHLARLTAATVATSAKKLKTT
jgi:uncharacterized protein YdhG (YjbR/CyaY superfamily)